MSQPQDSKFGPLILAAAKILFGTAALYIKLVATPILWLLFAQNLFGAVAFLPKAWKELRTLKRSALWLNLFVSGSFLLNDFSFYFAVRMMDVSLATLIRWIAPVLLAGVIFCTAQPKNKRTVLAAILGFFGLFLVLHGKGIVYNSTNTTGVVLTLLSAVAVTLYWYSSKMLLRQVSASVLLWLRSITALPILVVISVISFSADMHFNLSTLGWMVLFGIVYGIIASYLDTLGIQRTKTEYLGIIGYLVPLTTLIGAVVILHEPFTWLMVVGGILILGSGLACKK